MTPPVIRRLDRPTDTQLDQLVDVLIDCVDGDASVSFMGPLERPRALAFWRGVAAEAERGECALLVAQVDERIVGTVHLALAQPENQPHRADLCKLLVHRRSRGQGIAEALMRAVESVALECGKTLLVLDTASEGAARIYRRLGWVEVGTVPGYALMPRGELCDTTFFIGGLGGRLTPRRVTRDWP